MLRSLFEFQRLEFEIREAYMKKLILAALGAIFISAVSYADHSWSNYHWARTSSPFDLKIVNSTTTDWDIYVGQAISDWSASSVLSMVEDIGSDDTSKKTRRQCKGPAGQVRVCNLANRLVGDRWYFLGFKWPYYDGLY